MYTDIIKAQIEILQKCGSLAIDMDKLPLAFELLTKTLENDPLNLKSLLLLSNAYLKNKSFINVIHLLITAVNSKSKIILNNIMIWQKLAVSYYRLNRFDDSNHAILQALALFEKSSKYSMIINNNSITETSQQFPLKVEGTNILNADVTVESNNNNNNNNNIQKKPTTTQIDNEDSNNKTDSSMNNDNILPTLSEYKMYVLRCRILLLMDNRYGTLDEVLPAFDKSLQFLEKFGNFNYYLDVLITRAQFFKKFENTINCKNDLMYVLRLLDEKRDQLKPNDHLIKVSYTYYFLASLIYEENPNNYHEAIKLIHSGIEKYQHMTSSIKPLLLLETQLIFLSGDNNEISSKIDQLKLQLNLDSPKDQALTSYMIARLLLKQNREHNANQAYEYYQKTLKILPKEPWIWISIASLYLGLGQFDDALSTYTQAVNHSLYTDENQSEKSERSLSDASSVTSNSSTSNNLLPSYELKFNNIFAAIAWFGISQVYTATDEYKNAIDAINQALKLFKIEKDSENVNKIKTLLSKLIVLEVNSNNENSTEHTTDYEPKTNSSDSIEKIDKTINKDEKSLKYENPDVPIFVLIDLMNHRDGKLFAPIEAVEKEDICSLEIENVDEYSTDSDHNSLNSNEEIIDLTSEEINRSRKRKRSRINWENEVEENANKEKILKSSYFNGNQNYENPQSSYYESNVGSHHQTLPSTINPNYGLYNSYKVPMQTAPYDLRNNYQQANGFMPPEKLDRYNRREGENEIRSHYDHNQYNMSPHPIPIVTKSQIISMPVFIPDPRQSLPTSSHTTPIVHYEPNNRDFRRPYTAGVTPNQYVHRDLQYVQGSPQVDYNRTILEPSRMQQISSNMGQGIQHSIPTQIPYQPVNMINNRVSGDETRPFVFNGENMVSQSRGPVPQNGLMDNQHQINNNAYYTNPTHPHDSRYYQ
ncbi:similar to Saccharomyces cerevisiae YBR112C CYC8 General transcriptional co-repressor, acts together with Tup1p [Maudiozyma saulgeensis]|uniref:Similar to Saccharomyces cerevisiae YBR112C CYC8 General transcriptional co-repressor, acts together with Tup1p n=1 Tax=Maudiozyma saulgeensis TaxID=1789683 RepID=A0A1X7R887_9SACH|nr:similar to Saccharomyces cerevisiae YBR112C CYC8 General transcriptional co-repressor, acts together with Tup1p [Kazachstania saulgeensis]